jgi:hypothetical protein|tara:strand:- start:3029 stop:3322 length:294 start_codon:yes stop_codon:yes gene_type:complete
MSTYGQHLGSGWSSAGLTDVFNSKLPGDYMQASKSWMPGKAWAMDRAAFKPDARESSIDAESFQKFMQLQKNPEGLVNNIITQNSPDFVLAKMKFGK